MSSHITFIEKALRGEVLDIYEQVDDEIDCWHDSNSELSLADWLGMSSVEYSVFVERAESLPIILRAHRFGEPFLDMFKTVGDELSIAARTSSDGNHGELREWLQRTGRI